MGAPKGHKRYGGRTKGTPNKGKVDLAAVADQMGINPFKILLWFAAGNNKALGYFEPIEQGIRSKCAAEACQYIHPKRKAIEVSDPTGEPLGTSTSNAIEQLKAEIQRAADERKLVAKNGQ